MRNGSMKLGLIAALAGAIALNGVAHAASDQPTDEAPAAPKPHSAAHPTATPGQPAHPASGQAAAHPSGPPTSVVGFWAQVGDDGKVGGWFYFVEKNGAYEGRLVKMIKQPGDTAPMIETCEKCPGDQKDAAMLGLTIIKGMKRTGFKYEEGSILDPRDGTIYHAQMEMSPDGQKLFVRGYLGIPLLGQTQTWTRLPDNSIAAKDIPKDSHTPGLTDSQPAQQQDQQ
jgi:uncharacterized protein (DUF2147 family)